jgi:17beta-estradiol 17-dehydrogenase / very-long-chain 3-oxoacyl-CoA reductase
MPYVSVYSSTKSLNLSLSNALNFEFPAEGHEVETLCIVVGSVKSAGNAGAKQGWAVPTTRGMAKSALERVGCGRAAVAGYWAHGLQVGFLKLMPEGVVRKMLIDKLKPMRMRKATEEW